MRTYFEVATAAAITLVAAVVMLDTFGRSGWTANGPDSGWYPFWSAAAMGGAALIAGFHALRKKRADGLFASREGGIALLQLLAPMIVAVALLPSLGLFIVSGAYMALFARWVGRYPWPIVIVLAIGVPAGIFFGFDLGFKLPLPKSFLYYQGTLPF